jgi:CBS domain containing-hemolysin-like protein
LGDSIGGPSTNLIGALACIVAGAVFAAVDESLAALGEARARATAREPESRDAATAERYLRDAKAIGIRLLTGRILALVGTAVFAYDLALALRLDQSVWARRAVVAVAALVYATAIGTVTTLAARRASRLAMPLLRWGWPLEMLVAPLAAPLVWASNLIDKLYPPRPEDDPERVTEVVVEQLIERGEEQGAIAQDHAELLLSVLEFRETVAREIMVPRIGMVAVDIETPLPELIKLIVAEGHSRYPVYRGSVDHPVGVLYAKDLFRLIRDGDGFAGKIEDLLRTPVFYAAESQKISEVLRQMQARRTHLAIVADEYGGTSGMLTLEDIIEEIVGEIRDEHDSEDAPVKQIAPGRYLAKADVSVHDLAEITGLQLPENAAGYESLGGMLVDLAGRVPKSGELIEIGGHDLIVRQSDERRVQRVEVVERTQQLPPAAE